MRIALAWCTWFLAAAVNAAPLAMRLAPDLRDAESAAVLGRKPDLWQGKLQFAGWSSAVPAKFDLRTWSWEALLPDSKNDQELRVDVQKLAFEFALRSPGATGAPVSQCLAQGRFASHTEYRAKVTDETTITLPGYPRIDCKLGGPTAGRLSLRPDFLTQRDSGLVQFGERQWTVNSVNNLASQKSSFPLARFGYEFSRGGEVVAAVEIVGKGRVWFSPKLASDERDELAGTMAALLHYGVLLEDD